MTIEPIQDNDPNKETGDTNNPVEERPLPPPESPAVRKHPQKVDDPKKFQFTGRATEAEYNRINDAIELHKEPGKTFDIVRLVLKMINHIENDILQTFKTKKKKWATMPLKK